MSRPQDRHLREVESVSVAAAAIELRELRYFVALCEKLNLGRVAEDLQNSQSPSSQTVDELEQKLGARLLDRSSRDVRLTAAGDVLRYHAHRVLREADDAIGATRRAAAGERGATDRNGPRIA